MNKSKRSLGRKLLSMLLLATLLLSLASCSGGTTTGTSSSSGDSGASASGDAGDDGEPKLAAEQVLNMEYADLDLIDVNDVRNYNEFIVLTAVQEGLFRTFSDENGTDVVENAGCEKYEISEDGLTYTFYLRKECKWSDGEPVTAQNYVDSWMRLIDPESAFSYAFLATGIEGAEAYYNGEGSAEDVAIELIDDYTFSCKLSVPDAAFIKKVGMVCFYPIRKDLIDEAEASGGNWTNDYTLHVYNGPFYIADRVLENSMTLKKNESYWNADNVTLTQINLQVVNEDATKAQLMESGQLDVLTLTDLEYVDQWQSLVDNGTFIHYQTTTPSVTYLVVDQHPAGNGGPSGLMLSEKCRLAMSLAVDREEYNELFYNGLNTVAYSLIPYGITVGEIDYRATVEEPLLEYADKCDDTEYLQNLFKEGLEEAGFTGDLSDVTLTVFASAPDVLTNNILEWYKQTFETKLGVNVNVEIYPDTSTWVDARNNYQYDFYTMGWNGDFNDPMTFMELFVTDNGYAKFMGGFSDSEYDSLCDQAASCQDDEERLQLFSQAEQILMDKAGVIPLFFTSSQTYTQNYVTGLSMPMFGADFEFSRVQILEH